MNIAKSAIATSEVANVISTDGDRATKTDDSDSLTVHTDDEEFSEFISSQWKDNIEVALVIKYPLPFTNYLAPGPSSTTDKKKPVIAIKEPVVGRSIEISGYKSHNGEEVYLPQSLPELSISTVLEEGSIAPLFDGTQWAGTRVWKAAVMGLEYLLRQRQNQVGMGQGASILELGCGLGVPGMIWKQILSLEASQQQQQGSPKPPRVVLTDRESLVPQLKANIAANFKGDPSIEAMSLDWSREGIASLLQNEREKYHGSTATPSTPAFDICLNCDCVYEPLYGREAWESLADVLSEVALASPATILVTALERRNGDNVEGFLDRLEASGRVQTPIECVVKHDEDPHHVIEIYVTKGKGNDSTAFVPATLWPLEQTNSRRDASTLRPTS